jgi:3-oxoacyl-[acyl-carrier protein] reductase
MMRAGMRTAVVTGAAQGLGQSIATALHGAGHAVVVADIREDAAVQAAATIDPTGERAIAAALDVRERASFTRVFAAAAERFGHVDILINNAAIAPARPFFEIEQAEWDEVLGVNLRGVLFGCQVGGLHMRSLGWGRIINLASLAGQQGSLVAGAHYSASKAGIIVLTKVAAAALAGDGVTVNAVAPAAIDGPTMRSLSPHQVQDLEQRIPVGRIGRPEEVGALVAYLASEEAGYATGATFDLNGGLLMR